MNDTFWLDRPVFVTGATGLVGSCVTEKLVNMGASVVCLVRDSVPRSEFYRKGIDKKVVSVRGDLSNRELLRRTLVEYEIDTVFHLAAQAIVGVANLEPVNTFQSNVAGTWNLLDACLQVHDGKNGRVSSVVVASSDKAYGDQEELPYTEDAPLLGAHAYDLSKAMADQIAQFYARQGLTLAITRCGNFYGAGDLNWNRLIPGTIRSIIRGESPIIRSSGKNIRDYFYVKDGADAYIYLAKQLRQRPHLSGNAFNLSDDERFDTFSVVEHIMKVMDFHYGAEVLDEAHGEILHQYLDSSKARNMLDWRPIYSFVDGLRETIKWYEEFLS